ncbi:MAG: glycosyltransferase family 2 protein [candidate division Zixibacteria bacterium]
MKALVIIPAYNSGENLPELLPRIRSHIDDIVVIDDGSSDNTAAIANKLGAVVIIHKHNRGKGAALKTGFVYALKNAYDTVITIDSDCQHNPDDIPRFIQARKETEADMIIGSRRNDIGKMPWPRQFSNWSTSRFLSLLLKNDIEDSQCGYRLISRKLLESIKLEYDRFELESEIIIKAIRAGFKIGFILIDARYDKSGVSHMRPFADTIRWCRAVLKSL